MTQTTTTIDPRLDMIMAELRNLGVPQNHPMARALAERMTAGTGTVPVGMSPEEILGIVDANSQSGVRDFPIGLEDEDY